MSEKTELAAGLKSIDEKLMAYDVEQNAYIYAFTLEEIQHINRALQRYDLVKEIRQLLQESK